MRRGHLADVMVDLVRAEGLRRVPGRGRATAPPRSPARPGRRGRRSSDSGASGVDSPSSRTKYGDEHPRRGRRTARARPSARPRSAWRPARGAGARKSCAHLPEEVLLRSEPPVEDLADEPLRPQPEPVGVQHAGAVPVADRGAAGQVVGDAPPAARVGHPRPLGRVEAPWSPGAADGEVASHPHAGHRSEPAASCEGSATDRVGQLGLDLDDRRVGQGDAVVELQVGTVWLPPLTLITNSAAAGVLLDVDDLVLRCPRGRAATSAGGSSRTRGRVHRQHRSVSSVGSRRQVLRRKRHTRLA